MRRAARAERVAAAGPAAPGEVGGRRATLDVLVQLVGQVVNLALGIVVTALIVRALGRTGFGEWSTVFAVVTLMGYLADLKLEEIAVRHAAAEPEREADWVGALVVLSSIIGVPVALGSAALLLALSTSDEMRLTALLISGTILVAALTRLRAVFQLRVRNDLSVAINTANSLLWGAAVVIVVAVGGKMVALAVAFLATTALTAGLGAVVALRRTKVNLRGSRPMWRPLVRTGAAVGLAGLVTLAYGRIDQVLVFKLAEHSADAGYYGAMYRIVNQAGFVPLAVMTTLFPIIAAAHPRDLDRVRRLVQAAMEYLAMVSVPALAVAVTCSEGIVRLLFGEDFVPGATALPVLMLAFVAICFGYVAGNLVIIAGLQNRFVRYAIVGLVVNVGLNVWLIPLHGFLAAAWVTVLTEFLVVGLSLRLVLVALGHRLALGRLGVTVAAGVALWLALEGLEAVGIGVIARLVFALVAWPALLFGLRVVRPAEIRALLGLRGGAGGEDPPG